MKDKNTFSEPKITGFNGNLASCEVKFFPEENNVENKDNNYQDIASSLNILKHKLSREREEKNN